MRHPLSREVDVAYIGIETWDHRVIDDLVWTDPVPVLDHGPESTRRIGQTILRRYPLPGRPGGIITALIPRHWRFALALDLLDTKIDPGDFPNGPIHITGRVAALTRLESPELWPWHDIGLDTSRPR